MDTKFSTQVLRPDFVKSLSPEETAAAQKWGPRHLEVLLPPEVLQAVPSDLVAAFQQWVDNPDLDAASPVPRLIAWLRQHPEAAVREVAILFVCLYRDRLPDALPMLLNALEDPSPRTRQAALGALGCFAHQPEAVVPAVIALFGTEETEVLEVGVRILGEFGSPAVPPLLTALSQPEPRIRLWAVKTLGFLGPHHAEQVVPALLHALDDGSPYVRAQAATALGRTQPLPAVVRALRHALKDRNALVRRLAWEALGQVAPEAQPARQPNAGRTLSFRMLACILGSAAVVWLAAVGIWKFAGDSLSVFPYPFVRNPETVTGALVKGGQAQRMQAVRDLGQLRPEEIPAEAVTPLGEVVKDAHYPDETREEAARVLGKLGGRGTPAIPDLVGVARNPLDPTTFEAKKALANMGKEGRSELWNGLGGVSFASQGSQVAKALEVVTADDVPVIVALLEESPLPTELAVLGVLRQMGPSARLMLPALRRSYEREPNRALRQTIRETLEKVDPDAWKPLGKPNPGRDLR